MIITLYSTKSSTKTSIAISTAVYLAHQDKQVVVADFDVLQSSAHDWLTIRRKIKNLKNIDWVQKNSKVAVEELLKLSREFDWIVVDCAGQADVNGRIALTVADLAIIPIEPTSLTLLTLKKTLQICIEAQAQNPKLKVAMFLTRCSTNHAVKESAQARVMIEQLISDIDYFYFANTNIIERKAWKDIVAEGKGITESKNKLAKTEFNNLIAEILTCHS
jgi:chromosome partitioning protein